MTLLHYYWPVLAAGLVIGLIVGKFYFSSRHRKGS